MLAGWTQEEMAREVGISQRAVSDHCQAIMAEWHSRVRDLADDAFSHDLLRLEAAVKAIWPKVLEGNLPSVATLVTLLARKAKMVGYDAPERWVVQDMRQRLEAEGIDYRDVLAEAERLLAGGSPVPNR